MDKELFSGNCPGRIVRISASGDPDWSFIPDPLPVEKDFPIDVWKLLTEARQELARLDGVGRTMPNYNLLLRPLQRREALRSSSLEGTYATPEELLMFEIDPKEPKSADDRESSWEEVANYTRALQMGLEMLEEKPISLNLIRAMHKELLAGVRGFNKNPGNYRSTQVHIGSERRFIPPPPNEVMNCLDPLEKVIHKEKEIDSLIFCFMAHYQFETIHPFHDGNGRVGRLLLSLMIYEQCKLSRPWLYLSAFFDKYKDEYINFLFQVSSTGNWDNWIKFCLRGTIEQSKDSIKRFDNLIELRAQFLELLQQSGGGNFRLTQLIEYLFFESPIITVPRLSNMCEITYNTAHTDIKRCVKAGILKETNQQKRPKIYVAPHILDIVFGD